MRKKWKIGDVLEFKHDGKEYKSILTDEGWKLHRESPTKDQKVKRLSSKKIRDFSRYNIEDIHFKKVFDEDIQKLLDQFPPGKKHKTSPNFDPIKEIQKAIQFFMADHSMEKLPLARQRLELETLSYILMKAGGIIADLDDETLNKVGLDILWQESRSEELFNIAGKAAIHLKELPQKGKKSHKLIYEFIKNLQDPYENHTGKRAVPGVYPISGHDIKGRYQRAKTIQTSEFTRFVKAIFNLVSPSVIEMLSEHGLSTMVRKGLKSS